MKTHSGTAQSYFTTLGAAGATTTSPAAPVPDEATPPFSDLLEQQESSAGFTPSTLPFTLPPLTTTPAPATPTVVSTTTSPTLASDLTAANLALIASGVAPVAPSPTGAHAAPWPNQDSSDLDDSPAGSNTSKSPSRTPIAGEKVAGQNPAAALVNTPLPRTTTTSFPASYTSTYSSLMTQVSLAGGKGFKNVQTATASAQNSAETAQNQASADLGELTSVLSAATKISGKAEEGPVSEKKSATSSGKRTFIQSDPDASAASNSQNSLSSLVSSIAQVALNQPATSSSSGASVSSAAIAPAAPATAGMTNGKKEKDMNAVLELPQPILNGAATTTVASTEKDVHIVLGSNSEFTDALQQVMHVAKASGLSESTPPLRVEIQIQTPAGAVVNVYVSRQDDGYRAQLSTNDPQALSWLKDQVTSLRQSSDLSVDTRWLPAQLETTSTAHASSSSSWQNDQQSGGGQQQLPDERPSSSRQKKAESEDSLLTPDDSFFTALAGLGSTS
jgi:hypothetical protein